jgi:hypothetical protein
MLVCRHAVLLEQPLYLDFLGSTSLLLLLLLLLAVISMLVCRHAVLLEQPLYLDFLGMVGGWDNDAVWMKWRPQEGVKVHVVTLDGSKVRAGGMDVAVTAEQQERGAKVHVITLDGSKVSAGGMDSAAATEV